MLMDERSHLNRFNPIPDAEEDEEESNCSEAKMKLEDSK
jgi:hypothetical protein